MIKHKVKTSQEYRNEKECIAILKVLTTDLKVCRNHYILQLLKCSLPFPHSATPQQTTAESTTASASANQTSEPSTSSQSNASTPNGAQANRGPV